MVSQYFGVFTVSNFKNLKAFTSSFTVTKAETIGGHQWFLFLTTDSKSDKLSITLNRDAVVSIPENPPHVSTNQKEVKVSFQLTLSTDNSLHSSDVLTHVFTEGESKGWEAFCDMATAEKYSRDGVLEVKANITIHE